MKILVSLYEYSARLCGVGKIIESLQKAIITSYFCYTVAMETSCGSWCRSPPVNDRKLPRTCCCGTRDEAPRCSLSNQLA